MITCKSIAIYLEHNLKMSYLMIQHVYSNDLEFDLFDHLTITSAYMNYVIDLVNQFIQSHMKSYLDVLK